MGLDISAYRRIKADPMATEDSWQTHARIYVNPDFPTRADGITEGWYSYAESTGFRAGSYSGYGEWRDLLAKLAGYPATREGSRHSHSAGAWKAEGGPFWELINFSDCDGVIGPVTSWKLAADFAEWDERAKAFAETRQWFYELYRSWREAFEMAADSGAVEFH